MAKKPKQEAIQLPEMFAGHLIGLPKPVSTIRTMTPSTSSPGENVELTKNKDVYRDAPEETNRHGFIIDLDNEGKKVPIDLENQGLTDRWNEGEGYFGYVYRANIKGEEPIAPDMGYNPINIATNSYKKISNEIQAGKELLDEDKKYIHLVPYVDPETGLPILAKVTDSYKGLKYRGLTPYNKFGLPKDNASLLQDMSAWVDNAGHGTMDRAVGAARYGWDAMKFIAKYQNPALMMQDEDVAPDEVSSALEKASMAREKQALFNRPPLSKKAGETGTVNWLATGTADAMYSSAEFGLVGRGIGLGMRATAGVGRAFGAQILKQEAITKLSMYGSSAYMGFGTAYNEAIAAGIKDDGERLGYATLVGALTSMIEVSPILGNKFDEFLVTGGIRAATKELIEDKAINLSGKGLSKYLAQKAISIPTGVLSKSKLAAPEAFEEILQGTVEQGFKLAYNYLYKDDIKKSPGQGKFDIDEFSFSELAQAGFFGFLAPFPFVGSSQYSSAIKEVANGNENKLRQNLAQNAAEGKITPKQHKQADEELTKIAVSVGNYNHILNRFQGSDRDFLIEQLSGPLQARALASKEIDKKIESLGGVDLEDASDKSKEAKAFIQDRQDKITNANQQISKFEDTNYTDKLISDFKEIRDRMWEHRDNQFAIMAEMTNYEEAGTEDELVAKIKANPSDHYKDKSSVRTPNEAKMGLDAIRSGKLDPEYHSSVYKGVAEKGYLFNDEINTEENQKFFAAAYSDAGDESSTSGLKRLPLTKEERKSLAEGKDVPFASVRVADDQQLSDDFNSEENLNHAVDEVYNNQFGSDVTDVEQRKWEIKHHITANKNRENSSRMKSMLKRHQTKGVGYLNSLDKTKEILPLLSKPQQTAFAKMNKLRGANPIISTASGKSSEFYGVYEANKNFIGISGDFDRLRELSGKEVLNSAEKKELNNLRNDLFHKLVHEDGGHSYLDKAINQLHAAYIASLKGNVATNLEAAYFQRMVNLAELAYYSMKKNPAANGLYFMAMAHRYIGEPDPAKKAQYTAIIVKEFMAEALSNKTMQSLLKDFDLNDPKNKDLVGSVYGYTALPKADRKSLWREVVDALSSVFTYLKGIFSAEERNILTEAITLGAGADFDQYTAGTTRVKSGNKNQLDINQVSISDYNGVNLFEDVSGISPEQLINSISFKLNDAGIVLSKPAEFISSIRSFFNSIVSNDNGDLIVKDSVAAVYFKNTDSFMLKWKYEDKNGNETQEKAFFNKFGTQIFVNTNPLNTTAPLTVQKHLWNTFKMSDTDPNKAIGVEVVNNVRKAGLEGFEGSVHLELDEEHVWKLGDKMISGGQINIIYTTKDKTESFPIGYTHDLSKVRLARYLKKGVNLTGYVTPESSRGIGSDKGATALIKFDGDRIVDMMTTDDPRFNSLSTEQRAEYKKDYTYNPSLSFLFNESIDISSEIQNEANELDSITNADKNVEPKISKKDLSSAEQVLRGGFTNEFFSQNLQLSYYSPDQWEFETNTKEQLANFYQMGLLRSGMINTIVFKLFEKDQQNTVAQLVNSISKANQEKLNKKFPEVENLGFATKEELIAFELNVVDQITKRFGSDEDSFGQDDQSWSDKDSNPSKRISEAIKAAFESEAYEWEGGQYFVEFEEAEDVMLAAVKGTNSYADIAVNVEKAIAEGDYIGRQLEIAKAVLNHLTRDNSNMPVQNEFYAKAQKSYWSQFASLKRLDAVIYSQKHTTDESGLGAYLRYASEYSMINEKKNQLIGKFQQRFSEIKAIALAQGISTKEVLNNELYAFAINKIGGEVNSLTTTKAGTKSTFAAMVAPSKKVFNGKLNTKSTYILGYNGKVNDFHEIIGDIHKDSPEYKTAVDRLTIILDYFDIQIPPALLAIRENAETANKIKELIGRGLTNTEIRNEVSTLPLNTVNMVRFELKEDLKKKGVYGTYPMISLVASMVDHNLKDIIDNNSKPFQEQTTSELAKQLLRHEGNNRSPKFYLNTNFQKEYAYKTKSTVDDLFERLQMKDSETLKKYKASKTYKYNTVLDSIQKSNGEPIESLMIGLNAFSDSNDNVTFESAKDIDFLYMHLNGFVAPSNSANNSDYYYHVDDVPSDKPKNYLYRLQRIAKSAFKGEIRKIVELENEKLEKNIRRYEKAINPDGTIRSQAAFDQLVPGVHFKKNDQGNYVKGWAFSSDNFFYNGTSVDSAFARISEEAKNSYTKWTSQGLVIPLSPKYLKELKKQEFSEDQMKEKLDNEREKVYEEWYTNYVINRYHLSALTMGDYLFYKQDNFLDLSKRMAGSRAPYQKALFNKPSINVALINDVGIEDDVVNEKTFLTLPTLKKVGERYETDDNPGVSIVSKRTDAQGYLTEDFAATIKEAYGSLAGYEKIFKPVMFGVSNDKIADAQPLYIKLSLAVMPNPDLSRNDQYFKDYPKQLDIAKRLYSSNVDFAVFNSGIKVGAHSLNNLITDLDRAGNPTPWKSISFDSNLFGMQNNPYHKAKEFDNFLSGLLQITKQLGDNHPVNKKQMERYHQIEAGLIKQDIDRFFANELKDIDGIRELVRENLSDDEFAKLVKDFMTEGINVLDSPVVAKYAENILNAMVKDRTRLIKKHGEKLVNISDLGFQRPGLGEFAQERTDILKNEFGIPDHLIEEYKTELRWLGPRNIQELTLDQLRTLVTEKQNGEVEVDELGNIYESENGSVRIYPAEILVPPSSSYKIGSRAIGIRIPTSKKGSAVPSVVVGFLSESQGNGIVYGKHGTGVLGFDFDIDGMFTWRESVANESNYKKEVQEMFDIAYGILTSPRNYNEMISPVSTDLLEDIKSTIEDQFPVKESEAVYYVKNSKAAPQPGSTPKVNSDDVLEYQNKVKTAGKPLEFYTRTTMYEDIFNPETENLTPEQLEEYKKNRTLKQKLNVHKAIAPPSVVWRLDANTDLYNLTDLESGQIYIQNVDLNSGLINDLEEYETKVVLKPNYKFSKWSADRQLEAKRSNGDGKELIGVFANYGGINSLFTQYDVAFKNDFYYKFNDQTLRNHKQFTLNDERVSDIISELINAATDNAKLQLLSKLGINKTTAVTFADMVAHGFPVEYAVMFINQPAIKEYVRLKDNQSAASFQGVKTERIYESIQDSLISIAENLEPGYSFINPIFVNTSVAAKKDDKNADDSIIDFGIKRNSEKETLLIKKAKDVGFIPKDELNNINKSFDDMTVEDIDRQLLVLNKFRLYSEKLASATMNAGKLVSLTSGFPKTFIELYNTRKTIESIFRNNNITAKNVIDHPYYEMMLETVNNLLERYAENKRYAKPDVLGYHEAVAGVLPVESQQKLVDDFHTFLLTSSRESNNEANIFNLSTNSLTGKDVNPWDFVHFSAQVVKQMKKDFPDNAFLNVLKVISGKNDGNETIGYSGTPDYLSSMLEYELSPDQLSDARKGFDALPADYTYNYEDKVLMKTVPVTVKSTKDLVLGHLLHTKGMTLGGFSFSKILRPEIVKSFSTTADNVILNKAQIKNFFYQSAFNVNDVVKEITPEDISVFGSANVNIKQNGLDGKIEAITITVKDVDSASIETKKLLKIIKIRNSEGRFDFYEADTINGDNLNVYNYKLIEYKPVNTVKFYDITHNPSKMESFNDSIDRTNQTDLVVQEYGKQLVEDSDYGDEEVVNNNALNNAMNRDFNSAQGIVITEEQLATINKNLDKTPFKKRYTLEEINKLPEERKQKALDCYGK